MVYACFYSVCTYVMATDNCTDQYLLDRSVRLCMSMHGHVPFVLPQKMPSNLNAFACHFKKRQRQRRRRHCQKQKQEQHQTEQRATSKVFHHCGSTYNKPAKGQTGGMGITSHLGMMKGTARGGRDWVEEGQRIRMLRCQQYINIYHPYLWDGFTRWDIHVCVYVLHHLTKTTSTTTISTTTTASTLWSMHACVRYTPKGDFVRFLCSYHTYDGTVGLREK